MNDFISILRAAGFTEGVSGRWFSPDCKRGEGMVVEVSDAAAVVLVGTPVRYEAAVPAAVERFRQDCR